MCPQVAAWAAGPVVRVCQARNRLLHHTLQRRPALAGTPIWRDTPAIRGPRAVPIRFALLMTSV